MACPCPPALAPIPPNCVSSIARGSRFAATFAVANRWWEDGSIKWAHVDLQRDLAAHGEEALFLRAGPPQEPSATELTVVETEDEITVATGPLRFSVSRHGFELFRQVWLEGQALLAERSRGFHVSQSGRTAWASAEAGSRVTVEEANPLRVVIRAEGSHRLPDGSALLDFITRITAYVGQTFVRVTNGVSGSAGRDN